MLRLKPDSGGGVGAGALTVGGDQLSDVTPVEATLHLYAQPSDDEYLTAQQAYAAEKSWFQVQRLMARSHFPMLEVPTELVAHIETFLWSLPAATSA